MCCWCLRKATIPSIMEVNIHVLPQDTSHQDLGHLLRHTDIRIQVLIQENPFCQMWPEHLHLHRWLGIGQMLTGNMWVPGKSGSLFCFLGYENPDRCIYYMHMLPAYAIIIFFSCGTRIELITSSLAGSYAAELNPRPLKWNFKKKNVSSISIKTHNPLASLSHWQLAFLNNASFWP